MMQNRIVAPHNSAVLKHAIKNIANLFMTINPYILVWIAERPIQLFSISIIEI